FPLLCLSIARSHGGGYGVDGGGDRGLHSRPPFPFLLRGHDSGELRVAGRPRDAPPPPLRRPLGGGSFCDSPNLHFLILKAMGYAAMLLVRRYAGLITFFTGFAYLIGCHVYYMSGDALKEGGIDATGNEVLLALIKFFIN
ncbi:hypothetical protein B296_00054125, partial [Ensete ventricosum]